MAKWAGRKRHAIWGTTGIHSWTCLVQPIHAHSLTPVPVLAYLESSLSIFNNAGYGPEQSCP